MKPYLLFAVLMDRAGGSLPLAKKMGNEKMQSKLHRFGNGHVDEPARSTADAIASYFKYHSTDAVYKERDASEEARRQGVSEAMARIAEQQILSKAPKPKASSEVAQAIKMLKAADPERQKEVAGLMVEALNRPSRKPRAA